MGKIARSAVTAAFLGILVSLSAAPVAQAADDHASCVGIIVSTQAPAGDFDVNTFKDMAADEGLAFGQFVAFGAGLHNGTLQDCLP